MLRFLSIVALLVALLLCIAFVVRAAWIKNKIATLSAPASSVYEAANAALPAKGERPRIVLIGDSRIAQWPAGMWPEKWEIINRGIGRETAAQLALRYQADAVALDPDLIVIEAGINDLVAGSFMDEAAGRALADSTATILQKLARDASASGHRTLVATIIPAAQPDMLRLLVWNESLRDLVSRANAVLAKSDLPDGAGVIDLAASLVGDDEKTVADIYRLDTLHFNEAGYDRLTVALIVPLQSMVNAKP
jgi:lysophospholipase L1-like esterase